MKKENKIMNSVPREYILFLFLFGLRLCFINHIYGICLGVPMAGWAALLYYDYYYKKGQQKNGEETS